MSEQAITLRSTWHVVRRQFGIVLIAAAFGAGGGAGVVNFAPPEYGSTTKVLLPPAPQGGQAGASAHAIDTQLQIVTSEAVLGPAGRAVRPSLSTSEVARRVTVEAPTEDVLLITATGRTPGTAQALCEAVAKAELAYLEQASSTVDEETRASLATRQAGLKRELDTVDDQIKATQARLKGADLRTQQGRADAAALAALTAQQADIALQLDKLAGEIRAAQEPTAQAGATATIIQQASPAERTPLVLSYALYGLAGAVALTLLVTLALVVRARREPTVRSRDQIADAIGVPVVASVRAHAPRSVAGWISLVGSYAPPNVETWTLRQLLRLVSPGHPASLAPGPRIDGGAPGVLVLTLAGDSAALAVGPQLASFAASTGMRAWLVAAQPHESASTLWAACSSGPQQTPRAGLSVDSRPEVRHEGDLAVYVAVVDRQRPVLTRVPGEVVTILAVTAGAATAEELAKVALAADDADRPIARTVVVNADPYDRTTGRLLAADRAGQVPLPSLLTGGGTPLEATPLTSRRRPQ